MQNSQRIFLNVFSSYDMIAIKTYNTKTTNFIFQPGEEWEEEFGGDSAKSCFSDFKRVHRSSSNFSWNHNMQNRETNRLVTLSSQMKVTIKSYTRKTDFPSYIVKIGGKIWFLRIYARTNAKIENRKKKNHFLQIFRAFE